MRHYGQKFVASRFKSAVSTIIKTVMWSLFLGAAGFVLMFLNRVPEGLLKSAWGVMKHTILTGLSPKSEHPTKLAFYKGYFATPAFEDALFLGGLVGIATFALGLIGLILLFRHADKSLKEDKHLRGSELLTPKALARVIKKKHPPEPFDLLVGKDGIRIPEKLVFRHLAMIGQTGRGKSTLIKQILRQVRGKGKAMVLDLNGEFYGQFGQKGDRILSLGDRRSIYWDFWSEDIDSEMKAAYLVPEDSRGQRFFWKGPRTLLSSLLSVTDNLDDFNELLTMDQAQLIELLRESGQAAGADIIGKPGSNQAAGVKGTLGMDLTPLLTRMRRERPGEERFSIMDWILDNDDSGWVFVIVREDELEIAAPLLQCWINSAIAGCIRRPAETKANTPFLLAIDELRSFGHIKELPKALARLRKYNAGVILGYQDNAQLATVYGQEEAKTIKNCLVTKAIYSSSDEDSQKELSAILGDKVVGRFAMEEELGKDESMKKTYQVHEQRLVTPTEIGSLRDLEFFLKIGEFPPCKTMSEWEKSATMNTPMDYAPQKREIEGGSIGARKLLRKRQGAIEKKVEIEAETEVMEEMSPLGV